MLNVEQAKAEIQARRARTATRWAVNTLLWIGVTAVVCVLPALVIAGWRWFL